MDILLHNHSSYPIAARLAADLASAACIEDQLDSGVDVVTDGCGGALHPFASGWPWLDGVESGVTVSHGDIAYRCPTVTGMLALRMPRVAVWRFDPRLRSRRKAVLPGPYTLACLASEALGTGSAIEDLAMRFAAPLAELVGEAAAAGLEFVQVDEPALLWPTPDFRILRRAWEPLWEARRATTLIMATYGGEASGVYAQLNSVAADFLAVDLASAPDLPRVISSTGSGLPLILGLADTTSASPASGSFEDRRVDDVEAMLAHYSFEELHLQPARGLGGSSPAVARGTLERLASVRDALSARLGNVVRRVSA